ncbi:Uncharacterized protein SCF082_LOCUS17122 [Durusdinium trenchii]|uniref:Uncharacterized protein n=1 Tax=Durusdinium trenchii TaxID=1381693 RepID=A0ABP0KFD9_9DINO
MTVGQHFPSISPIASSYPGFASWQFRTTYATNFSSFDSVKPEKSASQSATPRCKKDFKAPVPQTLPSRARARALGGELQYKDPMTGEPSMRRSFQDYPCGPRSPRARYCAAKDWERRPAEMIFREAVVLGKVARIDWEARFARSSK